jgi:hypothetical protein
VRAPSAPRRLSEGKKAASKALEGRVKVGGKKFGGVIKGAKLEESMERLVAFKGKGSAKAMEVFKEKLPELEAEREASFRGRASLKVDEYKMVLKGKSIYVYGPLKGGKRGGEKLARLLIKVNGKSGEVFEGVRSKPKPIEARKSLERFGKAYKNMKEQLFLEREIAKLEGRGLERTVSMRLIGTLRGKGSGRELRLEKMRQELQRLKLEFEKGVESAPGEREELGKLIEAIEKEMGSARGEELEELRELKEKVEGYVEGDKGRNKDIKSH